MDFMKYIGFKLDEVKPILENHNICYEIIETFDTKKTMLGDECRIINIKRANKPDENDENCQLELIRIYVAYF